MKTAVITLFFALTAYNAAAQDLISWTRNVKISWTDFKGKVDTRSPFAAASAVGIYYKFNALNSGKVYNIKFTVYAGFDKTRSWSKKPERTAAILQHEQLHFDIAELVSRAFEKEAIQTRYGRNYRSEISRTFNRYTSILQKLQRKYDEQTLHSNNKLKQQYWQQLVHRELKR